MDDKRVREIKITLESTETDKLVNMWECRFNHVSYDAEAFEAIKEILEERDVALPEQSDSFLVNAPEDKSEKEPPSFWAKLRRFPELIDSLCPSASTRKRGLCKIAAGVLVGFLTFGGGWLVAMNFNEEAAKRLNGPLFISGLSAALFVAIMGGFESIFGKPWYEWYEWWGAQTTIRKVGATLIVVPVFFIIFTSVLILLMKLAFPH